jgi:pimeloyl-ACP methyl ester carboxylesterase
LILLPGLEGTGTLFTPFVQALGPSVDARVVSYPVNKKWGYAELEEFVGAQLPIDRRFVILGESFSGPIAMRIGAAHPKGLVGVVLCVTFASIPGPALKWVVKLGPLLPMKSSPRWLLGRALWGGYAVAGVPEHTARAIRSVEAAVLRHRLTAMAEVDDSEALAEVTVPILVLQASADRLVPAASVDHILKIRPTATRLVIEGPHLLLQTNPTACARAVHDFLQAVGA